MNIPTTNFNIELESYFKKLPFNEKKEVLHYHQYIINKFMIDKNRRGLLVFHSMGFGKTILAVSILESYRKIEPSRKAIILLPKSLQNNFTETLEKYIKMSENISGDKIVKENYKFISSNASNMFEQIGRIDKTPEEIEFEKNLGLLTDKIEESSLENSILVIDEFQNLSNAITNGSKNGLKLYNKIMKTKDIKLIFLTGTPIINHPFELVCTFNMITGSKLFPENIRDFITYFIDKENNIIKNKSKFQNRITGLISYYGDEYFEGQKPDFPLELPMKIEKVHMSKEQFAKYLEYREIEKKEEARKIRKKSDEYVQFNDKGMASSSYRIHSRQVSNFLIPEEALSYKSNKSVIKDINKISKDTYLKLNQYSPKFEKILENINKHKNQLQLVFSQFTSAEGLTIFSKVLDVNGFELFTDLVDDSIKLNYKKDTELHMEEGGKEKSKNRKYAIYSGDILPSTRNKIIEIFNSPENKYGEKIEILLISNQTGGLGLNLKGVRTIHIMEPYWNWALIMQIIGRGVRYKSHSNYPKEEQTVQPYLYISIFPKNYIASDDSDESNYTTDMHLYLNSRNIRKLNESFLLTLIEASVDCSIHHKKLSPTLQEKINCHLCAPTDENLYNANFYKDLSSDEYDKCQPLTAKKIETKEILFTPSDNEPPIKFYYNDSDPKNIKIFQYNENVDGYIPLKPSNPYYSDLIRIILNL
jgi:SNF2 family DNA or RNA helicase